LGFVDLIARALRAFGSWWGQIFGYSPVIMGILGRQVFRDGRTSPDVLLRANVVWNIIFLVKGKLLVTWLPALHGIFQGLASNEIHLLTTVRHHFV
jgi:hypothetical protein